MIYKNMIYFLMWQKWAFMQNKVSLLIRNIFSQYIFFFAHLDLIYICITFTFMHLEDAFIQSD